VSILNLKELPGSVMPDGREIKVALAPQIGNYDKALVLVSILPPKTSGTLHKHDESDEIIYVASCDSAELIEVVDGKEVVTSVSPGSLVLIRSGTFHTFRNTGSKTLELLCIFVPPLKELNQAMEEAIRKTRSFLGSG